MNLKKNKIYVMCGYPGSGKSTFIRNHSSSFEGVYKIISRDNIRFSMVKEDEEYFSKETEVFKTFIKEINDAIIYADTVVIDATHLNESSRAKLLRNIKVDNSWEINAIVIDTCLAKALEQNELRKGTRSYVPPSAIRKMANQFTMPKIEEGFDSIIIYNAAENMITVRGK